MAIGMLELMKPVAGSSVSLYHHLKQLEKAHGYRDPLLDKANIPTPFIPLWNTYQDLVTCGGLTWQSILAYSQIRKIELCQWEIDALIATGQKALEI